MGVTVLTDTFTRANVSAAWGTATDGNVWTERQAGGGTSAISVTSNEGQLTGTASLRSLETLGTPGITDGRVTFRFSVSILTSEADVYALLRYTDTNNYYWIGFNWINSTTFNLAIRKRVAGVNTTIVNSVITPSINTFYWIKAEVFGTNLYAKFWADGSGEPSAWTLTTTDSALTTGTLWGLAPFTAASGATVKVDNFTLVNPNTTGAATLGGQGNLTGTAKKNVSGASSLSGQGNLTATGLRTIRAAASLQGQGNLSGTASKLLRASATLQGQGNITATAKRTIQASATLAGQAILSAVSKVYRYGAAILRGQGNLIDNEAPPLPKALTATLAQHSIPTGTLTKNAIPTGTLTQNAGLKGTLT